MLLLSNIFFQMNAWLIFVAPFSIPADFPTLFLYRLTELGEYQSYQFVQK